MNNFSLRTKLIFSFSTIILIGISLSVITGIKLIGNTIVKQAQDKVRLDLNSAREIYQTECTTIKNSVRLTALRFFLKDSILKNKWQRLKKELHEIRKNEALDILTLFDKNGHILLRSRFPSNQEKYIGDSIVKYVLTNKKDVVSTQIITGENLEKESYTLAQQAKIRLIPTPKARSRSTVEETSGMIIEAAAPIFGYKNELIGILYGGKLINKNFEIVDKVKDIVYRGERHKGKDVGTVTIFQDDLRISTNVKRSDGTRAIGTLVSQEVYEQVVLKGVPWIGRAFVVNEWYRTAYEPLRNLNGKIIGMIYVGMLEAPYLDLKNRVVITFFGIALISVILLFIIAYSTTKMITNPLKKLLFATKKVTEGDFSHKVKIISNDEIGQLTDSFNKMTYELQKVNKKYLILNKSLEKKVRAKSIELKKAQDQLIHAEKMSSLGKLAAGIAHEINNPLTSILINAHLISKNFKQNNHYKENLNLIIDETSRCSTIVKSLLEFSRQNPPEKNLADINDVIEKTLSLLKNHVLMHKVNIKKNLDSKLPMIMIDMNKIKQVFANVIINAMEAIPRQGNLSIDSRLSEDKRFIEINFTDNGIGISEENVGKIFDPFFTTRGQEGTGLGLSISYGIVQQHKGSIRAQSKVGKGTTIVISLPVNEIKKKNSKEENTDEI